MSAIRSKRVQRVERELHQILSQFLIHGISVPLPGIVSISAVEVNPNLRHASVFFRLVGEAEEVAEIKEILNRERSKFQREVADQLKMKFCPVLQFEYGVASRVDEVDELLQKLARPRIGFDSE